MSWTDELYRIYKNNYGKDAGGYPIAPIFHSVANAQIEVLLSEEGEMLEAWSVKKKERDDDEAVENEAITIIPETEDSRAKSNKPAPRPLADELKYIAGDYGKFMQTDTSQYYQKYMEQLQKWDSSPDAHRAVHIIYRYLNKVSLMSDLINSKVLVTDSKTGKLKEKINGIELEKALVRFRINYQDGESESRTWRDETLYENYINYYRNELKKREAVLCYATGEIQPCTYKHPFAKGKAKLFSSNDKDGYTYRGRFCNREETFSIGFEYSQKIHNSLNWMVKRQGLPIGSMIFLAWESNLIPLPPLLEDPIKGDNKEKGQNTDTAEDEWDDFEGWDIDISADTLPAYKAQLKKAIWGNKDKIEVKSKVMLMVLDAASDGRAAITMYMEMPLSDLYQNVEKWHRDCAWIRDDRKKKKKRLRSFSISEIVECAFGTEQEDKKDKKRRIIECESKIEDDAIMRLIPCVTERRNVPRDIVQNLVNKASRPVIFKNKNNWIRVLEVACGMLRKVTIEEQEKRKQKGECDVALDKQCKNRDYLYGRLLAVAEWAERSTYDKERDENRDTNAERYFENFANKPCQTWRNLETALYKAYVPQMSIPQRIIFERTIGEIMEIFDKADFECNSKLQSEFLLAFHCQLTEMYTKKTGVKEEE